MASLVMRYITPTYDAVKIPIISPGLTFVRKPFLGWRGGGGVIFEGVLRLKNGSAYICKEILRLKMRKFAFGNAVSEGGGIKLPCSYYLHAPKNTSSV